MTPSLPSSRLARFLHSSLAAFLAFAAVGSMPLRASQQKQVTMQGWLATYAKRGEREIDVWFPSAAFSLQAGETLHPELEPADLELTYQAAVRLPKAGTYRFGLEVEGGAAELSVRDASNSEALRCSATSGAIAMTDGKGFVREEVTLEVRFRREHGGAARLRTLWDLVSTEGTGGFGVEPIPTSFTRVPDVLLARAMTAQVALRGRVLLEQKGCTNCHDPGERGARAVGRRAAPKLDGIGGRVGTAWLESWIRSPKSLRPGSDMPAIYREDEIENTDFRAVVQYLSARGAGAEVAHDGAIATEEGVLAQGRKLYHELGCIGCHGALESLAAVRGDEYLADDVPQLEVALPFGNLAGKWNPAALAAFLRDPRATHPDGRMPSFGLSSAEADLIATYLVHRWESVSNGNRAKPAQPGFGEVLSLGICARCHALEGFENLNLFAPGLDRLDPSKGCLDERDLRTPRYELTAADRKALGAGIESVKRALGARAPADEARRIVARLNCTSCHALDGKGGPPEELRGYFTTTDERTDLGDEGRMPPDLTGAGFKLTTHWLAKVMLEGGRARPYMAARMPQYGAEHVKALVEAAARREGLEPHTDSPGPEVDDALVLGGRDLMGRSGLACITCHLYQDYPAAGTPGPALGDFGERLRYEWYRAYMPDPARFKPNTRMPSFSNNGRSTFQDALGGSLRLQIDALWACCALGEFMPAPEGVERGRGLRLDVKDRPIVMRTFLESAGAHGIAIGTPVGVHFAFDAKSARLVEAWKGPFLDASGAWRGRGGESVGGRGPVVWTAPQGPPLAIGEIQHGEWPDAIQERYRFHGYRLDNEGYPTFLYEIDGVQVAECFRAEVAPRLRILREFHLDRFPREGVNLNAGPGPTLRVLDRMGQPMSVGRGSEGMVLYRLTGASSGEPYTFILEILP